MKTAVMVSNNIRTKEQVYDILDDFFKDSRQDTIVSDTLYGPKRLGYNYANDRGMDVIKVTELWHKESKSWVNRNKRMLEESDRLIAIQAGGDIEIDHIARLFRKAGKPVEFVNYKP